MKAIMVGVTLMVFFIWPLSATAEGTDMSVDFECTDTLVEGLPWIMTVTIRSNNPTMTIFPAPKIDLASEVKQGVALVFLFESQARSPIRIGRSNFGELEYGPLSTSISFAPGETVTSVFDMNQLLVSWDLREKKTVPSGDYRLTVAFFPEPWKSAPRKVTVRKQTAEEKQFVEAVQKQGIDVKWFPDVIVRDDLNIPNDIALPAESAQVRDFIKLLRLAVRDPGAAAKQIDDKKESWGSLRGALTELKYECIAKSEGKDSKAAQEMRRTFQADAKMKGRLTRLEKSGGLLDHFSKIREDMKKNEKNEKK